MLWSKYRGKKQTVSLGLVTCFCYFVSSPELHNKYYTFFSFPTQCGYLSLLSSLVTTPSTQPSLHPALGRHCVFITIKESRACLTIRPHYYALGFLTLVTL